MTKLLTLRKRVSFFLKNRVWLTEWSYTTYEKYGISVCTSLKGDSKWIAVNGSASVVITKISKSQYNCYEREDGGLYIFGTEGIFFKSNKKETLRKIFCAEGITGMYVCAKINNVIVFMEDHNDIVVELDGEKFFITMPKGCKRTICEIQKYNLCRDAMHVTSDKDIHLCVRKEERYFYMHLDNQGPILRDDVYFEAISTYRELLDNKLVVAKHTNETGSMIVTLCNTLRILHNISVRYIEKIINEYYFFSNDNTEKTIWRYNADDREMEPQVTVKDVKAWNILKVIFGVTYVKVINSDGITIVGICQDTVVTKKYPEAVDIKFSTPVLLSNGTLLEIKPIAVYEEEPYEEEATEE